MKTIDHFSLPYLNCIPKVTIQLPVLCTSHLVDLSDASNHCTLAVIAVVNLYWLISFIFKF
jgi:hypothetical protein